MAAAPALNLTPFTSEWLTSRTFTFRAEPSGATICNTFLFQRNGYIVGYTHANESHWSLDGDTVKLLDQNGKATCELHLRSAPGDKVVLAGAFLNPQAEYARTQFTHVLEENESDFHSQVQSFDLFDTLVARRCYEPLAIFRNVEAKSGIAGFAARRHAVEMSIFGRRTYGLDDIYQLLIAESFLTTQQAEVLQLMELEEEWDNLFPIGEVVARVGSNDIVISDMYLPETFVKRILKEKCGLDNKLYLSNYGKHQSLIWPKVKEQHSLRAHFGDNIHADIKGAAAAGIAPFFVPTSKWNKAEDILRRGGLEPYARALREARLRTFHPDPLIMNALKAQLTVNIPLMVLGTFWVKQRADRFRADKVLAAARDCNLWHQMLSSTHFARIGMPPVEYIQISRPICHAESAPYEAYFRGRLADRNLLVDMVGTGRSFTKIVDRLGLHERVLPCILVGDDAPMSHPASLETFIQREFYKYRIFIESMNTALDGSAVGAVSDEKGIRVLNQPNEFSDLMQRIIVESRAVFERFLPSLDTFAPPGDMPSNEILGLMAHEIIEQLIDQQLKLETLSSEQRRNLTRGSMANVVAG